MEATVPVSQIEGLESCVNGAECSVVDRSYKALAPSFHAHFKDAIEYVALYRQSETDWPVPPFDESLLHSNKDSLPEPYAVASDDRFFPPSRLDHGRGCFNPEYWPVVAPKPHVFIEPLIYETARQWDMDGITFAWRNPLKHLWDLDIHLQGTGLLDLKKLPREIERLFHLCCCAHLTPKEWMHIVRQELKLISEAPTASPCRREEEA